MTFGDDLTSRKDWQEWISEFRLHVLPKLEASKISVVAYAGRREPRMALEIGYSILLDKPIIVVHMPQTPPPPELVQVARETFPADTSTEAGRQEAGERLRRIVKGLT